MNNCANLSSQQRTTEKYNLALAPGLKLVDPKPLTEQTLAAIAAGLSESRHGFKPLNFVRTDVQIGDDGLVAINPASSTGR